MVQNKDDTKVEYEYLKLIEYQKDVRDTFQLYTGYDASLWNENVSREATEKMCGLIRRQSSLHLIDLVFDHQENKYIFSTGDVWTGMKLYSVYTKIIREAYELLNDLNQYIRVSYGFSPFRELFSEEIKEIISKEQKEESV